MIFLGRNTVLGFFLCAELAIASVPHDAFQNRVNVLAQEVRCLVCQNQSIAESNTPESLALKEFILDQLHQGCCEDDIREKLRALYGNDILFRPPFSLHTLFLWTSPFILCLAIYSLFIRKLLRKRRQVS